MTQDVTASIEHAKKTGAVFVYLTMHFATTKDDPAKADHDIVHYAYGMLDESEGRLKGVLHSVYANKQQQSTDLGSYTQDGMFHKKNLSYYVEVGPDGTLGVQRRINGKPIGGLPVQHLKTQAVGTALLSATDGSTLYSLSLDRQTPPAPPR